jgi:uncharacterized protein
MNAMTSAPGIPSAVLTRIQFDPQRLEDFCTRHHIARLAVFGSVLRDDFSSDSDVDVLVQFEPARTPAWEFFRMQDELAAVWT